MRPGPTNGLLRLEPSLADLVRVAAVSVIATLAVIALYLGRPILVPFSLAILLAFVLAPITDALGRMGLARGAAVICAVAVAVLILAGLAGFIGLQLAHLAEAAPHLQSNLTAKIASIRNSTARSDLLRDVTGLFRNLDRALAGNSGVTHGLLPNGNAPSTAQPVPVRIAQPDLAPLSILENVLVPLFAPLATLALVVVFVIFILLQKEDLRDRFISLAGARDLSRTAQAIDEGADRLSRYLLLQTTVNAGFGIVIATGLWFIGVPNPALWGLIAGLARFAPYVGVPIASVLPLALAFAIDPGWTMFVLTAILIFGSEAVVGQALEPWLYGRQMGLSGIAVVLSAVFWTWVWGPIGLLLSTPLTMCMVIMGRNVEHLRFLNVLLSDRAALTPDEALYLRLLKGNADEAAEHAEQLLKEIAFDDYLDSVLLKGLVLAQVDLNRGVLEEVDGTRIGDAVRSLTEFLADFDGAPLAARDPAQVLCVAGRGQLDLAAVSLLATLLERRGIPTRIAPAEAVSATHIQSLDATGVKVVCLCYLTAADQRVARYVVRRLRKQVPQAAIILGLWSEVRSDTEFLDFLQTMLCDRVATNLNDAASQVLALLGVPHPTPKTLSISGCEGIKRSNEAQ